MRRDDEKLFLGLAAIAALVFFAMRSRGPIVETIPSDEPLRGTIERADENWRIDR